MRSIRGIRKISRRRRSRSDKEARLALITIAVRTEFPRLRSGFRRAVGTASVVEVDTSDAKNPRVKIKVGKALARPVSLAEVKANKLFADSPLVRQGRLSVVPLTKEQYSFLTGE